MLNQNMNKKAMKTLTFMTRHGHTSPPAPKWLTIWFAHLLFLIQFALADRCCEDLGNLATDLAYILS